MAAAEASTAPARWRGIVLADGETVVKEYHASQSEVTGLRAWLTSLFAGPAIEGGDRYVAATTKRLLLLGETELRGGSGRIVSEVHLHQVSGLSCTIASGWMAGLALVNLIGKALLGLLAIVLLSRITPLFWILLVVWLWWLIGALMSQGRRVAIVIHAKDARSSPVAISSQAKTGRFSGHYEVLDLAARPGLDAEQMTAELGALVKDIQSGSAEARERWISGALCESAARGEIDVGRHRLGYSAPRVVRVDSD
jgi:hypothetical protein